MREAAEDAVGERDDRVEVGAGHGAEGEDQRDEAAGGGGRVLQQLQTDVVGREPLGGDARADDDGDEEGGADASAVTRRASVAAMDQQHGRRRSPAPARVAASAMSDAAERRRARRAEAGSRSSAGALDARPARLAEDLEVVAHQRLGHVERLDEVADAQLLVGEQLHDPPSQGLGQRLHGDRGTGDRINDIDMDVG